jgi:general secretion pathway protein J
MLVALAIFAILAAAGVGMLRASVQSQAAVEQRLGEIGQLSRLHALLASDLSQAVARATRGPAGVRPEFEGTSGGLALVRAGWTNLDAANRSDLQRVEWRLSQGGLVRIGHGRLDGADTGQPALLARDVASAVFRYRRGDGSWVSDYRSTPEEVLPAAVEMSVTRSGEAPILFILPVGADGPPPQVRPQPAGAA